MNYITRIQQLQRQARKHLGLEPITVSADGLPQSKTTGITISWDGVDSSGIPKNVRAIQEPPAENALTKWLESNDVTS